MGGADKANILLVDDQKGKLLAYEALLKDIGENLLMASSATEALELLLRNEVAVILIDVCMPDLDGFELARMIREHPRFGKTAIIFVSAIHLAETDHLRGYDAGAVDYIPVPLVPELLRAKVRVFVDLYRKTKQLELLNAELESRVAERTAALELSNSRLIKSEQGRRLSLAAGNMGSLEYHAAENRWTCDAGLNRILGIGTGTDNLDASAFFDDMEWRGFIAAFGAMTAEAPTVQREMHIRRRDGCVRICFVSAAASFDCSDNLERIDGVMADITDRKETERVQELLAREVDHRARNALANVQAIMRLTKAETLHEYSSKVERRVHALAHTHELLSNARWQGADIRHIVRDEMAPYEAGRTSIVGPSVILAPEKAQTIALTLHELATNAAKYGALSSSQGQVSIFWTFDEDVLGLDWIESGGPEVNPPVRTGFGTQIINASLDKAKGDKAVFSWHPKGLRCTLVIHCGAVAEQVAQQPAASSAGEPAGDRRRILVVEDEPLVAMLTCEHLERLGYAVVGPMSDFEQARSAIASEAIDMAVLDVNLAGKPVYPIAAQLRARGIPFIFLTGFSGESIDRDFGDAGVVSKPIDQNALAAAVVQAMPRAAAALKQIA